VLAVSFLSQALKFEGSALSDVWHKLKSRPTDLLHPDPLTTSIWNKVTGAHDTPLVNQFGGPLPEYFDDAERKGIDTGPAHTLHGIAQTVASFYGGSALGGLMGAGAGAAGGAGSSAAGTAAKMAPAVMRMMASQQPGAMPQAVAPPGMSNSMGGAGRPPVISEAGATAQPSGGPGPVIQQGQNGDARRRAMMAQILRGGM
jgi:hypothetical protein